MKTTLRVLIVLCVLVVAPSFAARPPERHSVQVDGHPIAVWSRVPAKPKHVILLVHGRTWSALPNYDLQVPGMQRSVMQSLNKHGFATYAVDLRCYGSTPCNADIWNTPNQSANDVAEVLKWIAQRHPRSAKPILFGWSMGSLVSHLAAQQHPELLSDLILYGHPRDPANTAVPSWPDKPLREVNTRERARSDFISPAVASEKLIETYVAAALKTDPIRADWKQLDEYKALDPAQIKNPTLLIHGASDPLAPIPAQGRVFVALGNPDRQWVMLAGGNHAAMLEDTHEAFIAAIRAFIERPRLKSAK